MKVMRTCGIALAVAMSGISVAQAEAPALNVYAGVDGLRTQASLVTPWTGFGLGVYGGLELHPNFAAELAYRDLGSDKVSQTGNVKFNYDTGLRMLGASVIAKTRFFDDDSQLFARLGMARVRQWVSVKGLASAKDTFTEVQWGLGAHYAIQKQLHLRVEFQRVADARGDNYALNTLSIGLNYHFQALR